MLKTRIIGLSGFAGSGKDLFFSELKRQNSNFKRFALADALKIELRPYIQQLYGFDILDCTRLQKERVRPILVEHGRYRRTDTHGTYWTSILKKQIDTFLSENPMNLACITDIRYDFYENDELEWLKSMNGILVHISKFTSTEKGGIQFQLPPNDDEAENDPKITAKSDYLIKWPQVTSLDGSANLEILSPYVSNFLKSIEG